MPKVWIDDLDDPRIAIYRHLKATNLTREGKQFVVEGEKLLGRLLESPFPIISALVSERAESRVEARIPVDVPTFVIPRAPIGTLVGFNFHQGVLGCGERRSWPDLDEIVRKSGRRATVLVCPKLDNPENLGAIVRIGDVFGIDAILVGGRCPDPLSRRVLRVSMGSALRLPVLASVDLGRDVARLRSEWGFELAATVVEPDAEPIGSYCRPDRLALFLGCESDGLAEEWAGLCTHRITIPMRPGAESLNVAVAAGIMLHHLAGLTRSS